MSATVWQVWVDTGGTFTDAFAIGADGVLRRAKVLSSGALRGTVTEQVGPRTLRIRQDWGNPPPDFIRSLPLTLFAPAPQIAPIERFDPVAGTVLLAEDLPAPVSPGTPFEVTFGEEAPLVACRLLTETSAGQPLPPLALRLATTRGTNALLTRSGTPPALFVTAGFGDLLEIGTQQRPDLFALDIHKPAPLYGAVVEVNERLTADGSKLRPLDETQVRQQAERLRAEGVTTAAVALLHSYRNPAHERRVAEILRDAGFTHVSLSSELSPFIKALPRAETAVVNAYLAPVIDAYLGGVRAALPADNAATYVMTSAGGLVGANSFLPKDSLLSGPAGGIVGAARSGERAGFPKVIAFDMGGTSTDVARFDGAFDYVFEHAVGDAHLAAPALAIESVAAGGGTVCTAGSQGIRVGPESAGASPGPACYGAGGPLTITDINLLLGRILPERFGIPLSPGGAESAAAAFLAQLGDTDTDRAAVLEGLLEIANERMADAIRRISVRRGYDPAEYALLSFGGAGGQHACAVAERLGMASVVVPPDASLLSAWGIGHAAVERFAERQVLRLVDEATDADLAKLVESLGREASTAVTAEGIPAEEVAVRRRIVNVRLAGQETSQALEFDPAVALQSAFATRFEAVFGYRPPAGRPLEVESVRVVAGSTPRPLTPGEAPAPRTPMPPQKVRARFGGTWATVPAYERDTLGTDEEIVGPTLIVERHSITVIETGWRCRLHPEGALILTREAGKVNTVSSERPAHVERELFSARFAAIAEEMGEKIRQNSISTNVKERLDFSCALLSPEGELVASAAHIPVHLGALGLCVRRLRETIDMAPGDIVVTNHPAYGGSHLPDVTVVTPVFTPTLPLTLLGYVANRAHHSEIGGTRPGSMPPGATRLVEEGVVIPPTYLFRADEAQWEELTHLLTKEPYPTRALSDNLADLQAAVAANRRGADALRELAARHGAEKVLRQMGTVAEHSETVLRAALRRLPAGHYEAKDALDDGTPLAVAITLNEDGTATIDFTGTGAVHPGNLNAPPAVLRAATLYVMRLLAHEPVPLNEGLLRPVTLLVPPGSLLDPPFDAADPAHCPAVVGGNTETSQRVVDLLLTAFGVVAQSQGTMNNILFGSDIPGAAFGYYETVCGGAGATEHAPGASAVHVHMTNTRITDVEILERRYPVRVERFAVRRGSGGAGHHPGGDGSVRELTFLAPVALSVLTQHRVNGPRGAAGGENGKPGRQRVVRADGSVEELGSVDGSEVRSGDRLILETPGGGGWSSL